MAEARRALFAGPFSDKRVKASSSALGKVQNPDKATKLPRSKIALVELGTKWKSSQQMIFITMIYTPPMMIDVTLMTIILIISALPQKATFSIVITSQNFTAFVWKLLSKM